MRVEPVHPLRPHVGETVEPALDVAEALLLELVDALLRVRLRGDEPRATDESDEDAPRPARRWAPRPRRPELVAGRPGVMLFVADNGPGVPESDRARIFDPFFTTKEPGQGTGLGLAIVARTVHESGGVVWVDRAREGGAVFKVFLPLAGGSDASADR